MKRICIAALVLSALSAQAVKNKDWYVSDDMQYGRDKTVAANCTNDLAYAVANCSSGYTVWVDDGFVWDKAVTKKDSTNFRLAITSSILVRSESGYVDEANEKGAKIVGTPHSAEAFCGDDAVACVYAKASKGDGVTFFGFVLEDGCTKSWSTTVQQAQQVGGGVKCSGSTVVSNCVIRNCHAGRGSATSRGKLYNCVITNNSTGAGVLHCPVYVEKCHVLDNRTRGLNNIGASFDCIVTNSTFAGNSCSDPGAGIYQHSADHTLTFYDCIISNNTATGKYGGGVAGRDSDGNARPKLYRCEIVDNTLKPVANGHGGGGVAYCKLYDCKVRGNVTTGDSGGGMARVTAYSCEISGNTSANVGGGALDCTLYNCLVCNNSSAKGAAGLSEGSAINCTITGNKAESGKQGGFSGLSQVVNVISYGNTPDSNSGGNCTNCCLSKLASPTTQDGCIFVDPRLDARYAPKSAKCHNKAYDDFDWMTDPNDVRSKDVYGAARVQGKGCDIGAVEQPDFGLMMLVR